MLNIKSSSYRDNSVYQIMMHINMVELKTCDNQLGFLSGIINIIDLCDLSVHFCSLKGCNSL